MARKRLAMLVAAMLGLSSGASVALFPARADAENLWDKVKSLGELVLCTEFQFAPFEFLEGGKSIGYSVDLMDLVAADLGIKVRYTDLPFVSVLPALTAQKCDMVEATTTITKARLERYYFTLPIADATVALVKRADDDSIKKPSDIAGKAVGGTKGSAQTETLRAYVNTLPGGVSDVKEYIGSPNAYADLSAGRVVAVAQSLANIVYLAKQRPKDFAVVLPPIGPKAYFGWFTRKEDSATPLIDAFNASLRKLQQSGKMAELQKKWFNVTMELPTDPFLTPSN
jgi:polar amino acid transport system substrate-binding protein